MNKRSVKLFSLLCAILYGTAYLTRQVYAASLAEIILDLGVTKEAASAAVTGAFITYGGGQIFTGIIGDRFSPRGLVAMGILGTAACNLLITLPVGIVFMTVVWCFNGLFQALIWPPLMRSMTEHFTVGEYRDASALVSAAAAVSTILIYLIVPGFIRLSGWRSTFFLTSAMGILMGLVWFFVYPSFPKRENIQKQQEERKTAAPASLREVIAGKGIPLIMIAIAMQGILRDGVQTWMPTYLTEQFHMASSSSILSTVILPVFSTVCIVLATALVKHYPNDIFCAVLCFIPAAVCSALLVFVPTTLILPTALEMALLSGSMHGVNIMLTSQVPMRFAASGRVSTLAGFLNCFTYVGSAVSTYGIAVLSQRFGWNVTLVSWLCVALIGSALCLMVLPKWCRFTGLGITGRKKLEEERT